MDKEIKIPFGAKDSELNGWEYTIPENMEAEIKDGKIIVREKESDDERIVKDIITTLSIGVACDESALHPGATTTLKEAIAYLERQKEQKTAVEEVLIKAGLKPFKDGNQWCILVGDNIQEGVCGFGDTIEDALYEFLKEVCEPQQPVEWSDSVAKEMFIKALERAVEQTKKGYELTDCDKHSWWEDFKAYSGIKSAEWSEEDEEMIARICANLEYLIKEAGCDSKLKEKLEERIKWMKRLKSLRDNYKKCNSRWKPSEEQMKALQSAIVFVEIRKASDYDISPLKELYEQLKKL